MRKCYSVIEDDFDCFEEHKVTLRVTSDETETLFDEDFADAIKSPYYKCEISSDPSYLKEVIAATNSYDNNCSISVREKFCAVVRVLRQLDKAENYILLNTQMNTAHRVNATNIALIMDSIIDERYIIVRTK